MTDTKRHIVIGQCRGAVACVRDVSGPPRRVYDFHGQFSSLALGYNHPTLLCEEFRDEVAYYTANKLSNKACATGAQTSLVNALHRHDAFSGHPHLHFCSSGALAVEAALKVALQRRPGRVVMTRQGFHGVYGLPSLLSARGGRNAAGGRCDYLPQLGQVLTLVDANHELLISSIYRDASAVVVEPICSTAGDIAVDVNVLREVRRLCDENGTLLVFDEVQTGFGATGAFWYWQQLGIVPDVVVFGKRAQVAGIASAHAFDVNALSSTFDGDPVDMVRCRWMLRQLDGPWLLQNVRERGEQLHRQLRRGGLSYRGAGLLGAIDFETFGARDHFIERAYEAGVWLNTATLRPCARVRPPLTLSVAECTAAVNTLCEVYDSINLRAAAVGFQP